MATRMRPTTERHTYVGFATRYEVQYAVELLLYAVLVPWGAAWVIHTVVVVQTACTYLHT